MQKIRGRASSRSSAYTMYAKDSEPELILLRQRILYTQKIQGPGSFCSDSVYYVRKRSGPGLILPRLRILCTQRIRSPSSNCLVCVYCIRKRSKTQTHSASSAYTMYAKDSEPELILLRQRILCTQKILVRAHSASSAYTVYAKKQGLGCSDNF